jgi:hypothetical protein
VRGIDGAVMDLWIFPYVKGDQTSVRVRARLTAQVFATFERQRSAPVVSTERPALMRRSMDERRRSRSDLPAGADDHRRPASFRLSGARPIGRG